MSFIVKCDRCGNQAEVEWVNVDTGYWAAPAPWLLVAPSINLHLCPTCTKRALEPDSGQNIKIPEEATHAP